MFRRRFLIKKDSGLSFTDQSTSQMSAAQTSLKYVKTVLGEYYNTVKWGTTSSNIYVCYTNDGGHVSSSFVLNTSYYLLAEIGTVKYALGSYNGSLTIIPYESGMSLDNHFKWTISSKTNGYNLQNVSDSRYAFVTASGDFGLSTTAPEQYFTISSGLLSFAYKPGDTWVAYRYSSSAVAYVKNTAYTAKLYSISKNGTTITLSPLSDENNTLSGTDRVLVVKNSSGTRYIVGLSSSYTISMVSFTPTANGVSGSRVPDDAVMTFYNSQNDSYWNRHKITVSGINGVYSLRYQANSKYLTPPTGTITSSARFTLGNNEATITYNDTNGIYLINGYNVGPFGISSISQGFKTTDYTNDLSAGGTAILYQKSGASWSPYYGQIQAGGEYALVVLAENEDGGEYYHALYPTHRRKWETTAHTYLANGTITSNNETIYTGVSQAAHGSGYDLTVLDKYIVYDGGLGTVSYQPDNYWTVVDGELVWNYSTTTEEDGLETTTWNTRTFGVTESHWELSSHSFSTLEDVTVTDDCEFTALQGTNGFTINYGELYVNVNNNVLTLLSVGLEWAYMPNSATPDYSRIWSVTTQSTNYYPEYANSDLEANTGHTDTTCDIFLVQNGKVQIQADEFVDGQTYVLVFVDNGNHYAACVNGTDIVPVLYANKLPTNLPSDYHFVAEASGQGFLLIHNNQAMGVAVNTKLTLGYNAVWSYTGTE